MTKRYTRRELYDLVWSEPMTSLALKIKISTTTIRKGCHGLQVPIPPQGHWLRKAHNKPLESLPLPEVAPEVRDGYLVREKDCQRAERRLKEISDQVRRLKGKRIVLVDGHLITAYHARPSKERRLLQKAELREMKEH